MTRRERLERKVEKRREWAEKAEAASDAAYKTAHRIGDMIPPGQPILIGHHSEKRHRRDLERIDSNMRKSIERRDMAATHVSKADNLEVALEHTIFSDDDNAIEALEARIQEHDSERERMKNVNKLYRKGDAAALAVMGFDLEQLREKLKGAYSWCQQPYPGYELSNLGGRITADRKRLELLKVQKARSAKADAAPNGVLLEPAGEYVRVTFAEKPAREILQALRDAGFWWGAGSWGGKAEAVPEVVKQLAANPEQEMVNAE